LINLLERAVGSIRQFGVRRTMQSALSIIEDQIFELRYGTDTLRTVNKEALNASSENQPEAEYYCPTRGRAFRKLLLKCAVPRDRTFVDLGAGKGKVLLLAARYGFKRVVGVEFSPELYRIAQENAKKYGQHLSSRSTINIVLSDVVNYPIQDDECVFFMFNPFGASVMRRIAKNISTSLDRTPRRIWIIYGHPTHRNVLEAADLQLIELARYVYGPIAFFLYSNQD